MFFWKPYNCPMAGWISCYYQGSFCPAPEWRLLARCFDNLKSWWNFHRALLSPDTQWKLIDLPTKLGSLVDTFPKTNSNSSENSPGPKRKFIFKLPICRCKLLVSGWVVDSLWHYLQGFICASPKKGLEDDFPFLNRWCSRSMLVFRVYTSP